MRDDNETLLQRLIAGAANLVTPKSQIRLKCPDCGLDKLQGDSSPCGSHPPLSDPSEDTLLVRIGFVKPKPALEQPKVEKVGRSEQKQVSNRFKDPIKTEADAIEPTRQLTDEEIKAEAIKERNRLIREHDPTALTGAPRRREYKTNDWSMSSEELARRQDMAEGFRSRDDDDPDVPHYMI